LNIWNTLNILKYNIKYTTRYEGSGEKYIIRSLMICTPHPILFGCLNGEGDGQGM
jgi:hypothetical protein